MEAISKYIPLFIPIILLQVILIVVALIDLSKRETVPFNSKILWILIIVLVNILGPILYLLFGRRDNNAGA